jgi:hypothetical protein
MREGKIVADGEAAKILTDQEVLTQASIVPPQTTQIFLELSELSLPLDVIDVYDAQQILQTILKRDTE